MRQFKDSDGKAWTFDLAIGTVMRVKAESDGKFNLFDPASKINEKPLLDTLAEDLPTFWELLVHLAQPPDTEAFGRAMAADCLVSAQHIFMEEWRDFFHQLQQPQHAATLEKTAKYREAARQLTEAKLKEALPAMDEKVQAKMEAAANAWHGNLLASLDSIRDPSLSANSG